MYGLRDKYGLKEEECGLIIVGSGIHDHGVDTYEDILIHVLNPHPDPANHFAITVGAFEDVMSTAYAIDGHVRGVFHTHLAHHDAEPSEDDLSRLQWPLTFGCVLHVPTKRITYYSRKGITYRSWWYT